MIGQSFGTMIVASIDKQKNGILLLLQLYLIFLTSILGSTEVSQCLHPFPSCFIFATVYCHNRIRGLILLQQNKCYFLLLTSKTSAFVTFRVKCSLRR